MFLFSQPVRKLEVDVVERYQRRKEVAKNPNRIILAKDEISQTHQAPDNADDPEQQWHNGFFGPS
jgi:hypothetical protein